MTGWQGGTVWRAGLRGVRHHWLAITVPLAIVLAVAYGVAFVIDEPLRRYTEAKVNRALKGEQEKGKPFARKVYERLVGGVAKLLENRSREEVATKSDVSGRIDSPQVSVVDVVLRLVQNAFFKAILPGFDLESGRAERVRRTASR